MSTTYITIPSAANFALIARMINIHVNIIPLLNNKWLALQKTLQEQRDCEYYRVFAELPLRTNIEFLKSTYTKELRGFVREVVKVQCGMAEARKKIKEHYKKALGQEREYAVMKQ
jgi:hypothetical protein